MTSKLKNVLIVVLAAAAAIIGAVLLLSGPDTAIPLFADQEADASADVLVRPDSHRLSDAPPSAVTFVEFLDFDCEACRSVYPMVEQLRSEYGHRVGFVMRYFPTPSQANTENAAVAVEAGAAQGRFEQMYRRLFETQEQWGNSHESQAPLFRSFAAQMGLDMAAYDRSVADPATLARVRADRADGTVAGVEVAPTFFVDGQKVQARSIDDLRLALDRALPR